MKKSNVILALTLPLLMLIAPFLFAQTVTIGSQVWMTKNLDVSKFRNGDIIPEAKTEEEWKSAGDNEQPAWCYYNNDPKNGVKFGKLYNWYAVIDPRGLAPRGYHIPTDAEWALLTDYLGGEDIAGTKMKSTSGWSENGNGTNTSGFSGLPGGTSLSSIGQNGYWWSSTLFPMDVTMALYCNLRSNSGNVLRDYCGGRYFLSVRCLRD